MDLSRWVSWWGEKAAPKQLAIVYNDERITYGEMNMRISAMALGLHRAGVRKSDRVAILLHNRPDYLILFFACAKLGALAVPLNTRLMAPELAGILQDATPSLLVYESAFTDTVEGVRALVSIAAANLDEGDGRTVPSARAQDRDREDLAAGDHVTFDDDLAICYTSGTTGRPRGAVITQGGLHWTTTQAIIAFGTSHRDVHLITLPLCYSGGLLPTSMPIFHSGGTMVLEDRFDPDRALEAIGKHGVTRMSGVPTMFQMMLERPNFGDADLSSLQLVTSGGAPVPTRLTAAYRSRGVPFTNGYGLTEGGGLNMFCPPSIVAERPGSYTPCLYNEVRLACDDGREPAIETEGELLIAGPVIMRQYWRDADATADTIRDGWLHTGDVARRDGDGYLSLVDRTKDIIISGGLNVFPSEVEKRLQAHPKIRDAAVVGLQDVRWGEAITAFVELYDGEQVSEEELMGYCASSLADYKRPKSIKVVTALPRTQAGKVLKRELRLGGGSAEA